MGKGRKEEEKGKVVEERKYTNWTDGQDSKMMRRDGTSESQRQQGNTVQHNTTQSFPRPGVIVRSDSEQSWATLPHQVRPPSLSLSISKGPTSKTRTPTPVGCHGAHIKQADFLRGFRQQNYNEWINCLLLFGGRVARETWTGAWVPYEARCLELCRIRRISSF